MDTDVFRRFLAVVESGSLNKAARLLNVSQPALSKSVQQLEAHYGVPLLHRGAQGISPTAYGAFLVERFKLLRNELGHVEEEMRALSARARRRVTVGAPPGLGYVSGLLVRATTMLCAGPYPLSIDVRIGSKRILLPLLKSGEIDLLLAEISRDEETGDMTQEVLFSDQHTLAVRNGHPLAGKATITLADLIAYPWIVGRDSEPVAEQLMHAAAGLGLGTGELSLVRSESSLYIGSVVANSDFIGIVTADSLELGVLTESLRRFWVGFSDQPAGRPGRDIGVIYRGEASLSVAGRAMLKALRGDGRPPPDR